MNEEDEENSMEKESNNYNADFSKILLEQNFKFEYREYKFNVNISKDNNYIKIICCPKKYKNELYEYILNKEEFNKIFEENQIEEKTSEDYFLIIKKYIKEKKILIKYDKNLYTLTFNIRLKNETKLSFKRNINEISKIIFKNNPNLKFKETILLTNCGGGCNSPFDVFLCYKDSKQYLASSNYQNCNIEIIDLENNQLAASLKRHKNEIFSIRYFLNNVNKEEYLISSDSNKIVIVWNILKDFKIEFLVAENYSNFRHIYSCIITNIDEFNYVIISSYTEDKMNLYKSSKDDCTKMYSLMNGGFIKNIYNTNNNCTRYLLSWHNEDNYNDYIIELCDSKISINNLLKKEKYCDFESEIEGEEFLCGFLYSRKNIDYLCTGSWNGYIRIWDLYEKNEIDCVNTQHCQLYNMIPWSNTFVIIANKFSKSFNVIDIETLELIAVINNENLIGIKCIRKIIHPLYGESLLTCSEDGTINLYILYNKI